MRSQLCTILPMKERSRACSRNASSSATPESVQEIYESTLQIHAKTRVPRASIAGVQNMIDALLRMNPRLAKVKAADIVDNSFVDRLEKSGYIAEALKRGR